MGRKLAACGPRGDLILWVPIPGRTRVWWRSGQPVHDWSKDGVEWSGWGSHGGSPAEKSWARGPAHPWRSLYPRVTRPACLPSWSGRVLGLLSDVTPSHSLGLEGQMVLGVGWGEWRPQLRLHWASLGLSFPSVQQGPLLMFSGEAGVWAVCCLLCTCRVLRGQHLSLSPLRADYSWLGWARVGHWLQEPGT